MSDQIPAWHVKAYKDMVYQLLQQRGSKLRGAVTSDSYTGKLARVTATFGPVEAVERTTRHSLTEIQDTPHSARWVAHRDYTVAGYVDTFDEIMMLADPKNAYSKNHAMALGRKIDDVLLAAMVGVAKTGEEGSGTESFDTANFQIATAGLGLTVAKLRTAKAKFINANVDVDNEELYCAINGDQVEDLLAETQVTSSDYAAIKALVDGDISRFMGYTFIKTTRLLKSGTDFRVPVWAKSGVHLGMPKDIMVKMDQLPERNYTWQVYGCVSCGGVRLEQGKVIDILCV